MNNNFQPSATQLLYYFQVLLEGATEPPTKPKGRPRKETLTPLSQNSPKVKSADMPSLGRKDTSKEAVQFRGDSSHALGCEEHSNLDYEIDIDNSSASGDEQGTVKS